MAKLTDVQKKIKKSKKWGFLAEMVGETDLPQPTAGVTHQGVLLVNPNRAMALSTDVLVDRVREEFKVAAELREKISGFF
jgi:hypothetical protein